MGRANLEVQVAEGNSTSANGTSTESEAPIITQPTGKPWHVIADNYGVMDQVRKNAIEEVKNNQTAADNLKNLMDEDKKAGCVGCTGKLPADAAAEKEESKENAVMEAADEEEKETKSEENDDEDNDEEDDDDEKKADAEDVLDGDAEETPESPKDVALEAEGATGTEDATGSEGATGSEDATGTEDA